MRVLFITSRVPGRHFRGDQLRAFHHLIELGKRHAITLLAFDPLNEREQVDLQLRQSCEKVIVVPHSQSRMALLALRAIVSGRPFQVEAYRCASTHVAFLTQLAGARFDLVHVQLVRLGALLERHLDVPVVIDWVDALSINMRRRSTTDRWPQRWLAAIEASRLARYERALSARAVATCTSAQVDIAALEHAAPCHPVNNGVDLARFPFVERGRAEQEIVFVGNLGYFPNVDAINWFVGEVFPSLVEKFPMLCLRLVGARPVATLKVLAQQNPAIELVGEVPDVHPYLARASLAIAPLRAGSGQQLKVIEAMASGTPIVASDIAAGGVGAVDNEHLLVATDARSMVDAIDRLLRDSELRTALARNARTLVEANFSWQHSAAALDRVWDRARGRG